MGRITVELYQEILAHVLEKTNIQVVFPDLEIDAEKNVGLECYKALKKSRPSSKMTALMILSVFKKLRKSSALLKTLAAAADSDMISVEHTQSEGPVVFSITEAS